MSDQPTNDPFAELPRDGRERVRLKITESQIASARLWQGDFASVEDEIRKAGYQDLSEFFGAALARTRSFESFFQFVRMFHFTPDRSNIQLVDLGLRAILRTAIDDAEPFIRADSLVSERDRHDFKKRRLNPRAAAEWIYSMPSERGLLPPELCEFIRASIAPTTASRSVFSSSGLSVAPVSR
jgi:hypothetical protein